MSKAISASSSIYRKKGTLLVKGDDSLLQIKFRMSVHILAFLVMMAIKLKVNQSEARKKLSEILFRIKKIWSSSKNMLMMVIRE